MRALAGDSTITNEGALESDGFLDMVIWIICKKMITMGFRSGVGFLSYDTLVVYLCNCSLAV